MSSSENRDKHDGHGRIITGILVAAAVVTVLTYLGLKPGSSPSPPAGKTTSSVASTSTSTSTEGPAAATTYVDELQQTASSNEVTLGAANVGGRRLGHGVTINSLSGTAESPNGATFALPGQFTAFRAVVGVDPGSAPGFSGSVGIDVSTGTRRLVSTVVSRGSPPCSIDVSITGAQTLTLAAYLESGEPLAAAFGDPRVLAGADFAGMPSAPPCPK